MPSSESIGRTAATGGSRRGLSNPAPAPTEATASPQQQQQLRKQEVPSLHSSQRHERPASHPAQPSNIEVANRRFDETAPPVHTPTAPTPRPPTDADFAASLNTTGTLTTAAAAAAAAAVKQQQQQLRKDSSTGKPAAPRQHSELYSVMLNDRSSGARAQVHQHGTPMRKPSRYSSNSRRDSSKSGRERQSRRRHSSSSPRSSQGPSSRDPYSRHGSADRRSRDGKRNSSNNKQRSSETHSLAAPVPRIGRPFDSNPDLGLGSRGPALTAFDRAVGGTSPGPSSTSEFNMSPYSNRYTAEDKIREGNAVGAGDGTSVSTTEMHSGTSGDCSSGRDPTRAPNGPESGITEDEGLLSRRQQEMTQHQQQQQQQRQERGGGAEVRRHVHYDPHSHNDHHGNGTRSSESNHASPRRNKRRNGGSGARYHDTNNTNGRYEYDADDHDERHNNYSTSLESVDTESTTYTKDSFGYPIYHPIFRSNELAGNHNDLQHSNSIQFSATPRNSMLLNKNISAGAGGGKDGNGGAEDTVLQVPTTTDVPWDLRNIAEKETMKTFAFLSTRHFWFLIEYALRVTFVAMMIPSIIVNLNLRYSPFISDSMALTSVVIAVGTNFGQSCVFFVQYTKGGCIWLPLATICSALELNKYLGAWFVVYVVLLFLMAVFTENTTRRMCLLLFNISMVSLLNGDESLVFPTRVLADWALGAAFALAATLIPYPMLATRVSAHISKIMFKNTATCFTGILSCFWAPSNTERSMSMVRIRSLVRTLDHLIEKFDSYDGFTFYEVLIYETYERREVRKEKVKLLLKLKMNLRAMERVINMVQEKPQMIDLSERCLLLRDHLSIPMDNISRSMEALLWRLSEAKKYEQLRTLSGYFEATGRSIKRLQTEFDVGRRVLFYEHQEASMLHDGRMEEFVPLMTFFVFSIVNFWTTLEEFETFIDRHKHTNDWKESFYLVWKAFIDPFKENVELVRLLCVRRAEPEVRVVIEAAKVSVAMLLSVIFFYYVDNQSLLLTGPSIIAFVSGTNPVEAVQAGAARMSGTLIGAVLGFFAASLCHSAVDRVVALCVITFVMTFFRPGQKFGIICMYCNFVAVSSLAPEEQTAEKTISRIQQNTFAIFIYCFISVAIFPVSPNHVLFQKRILVMRSLNTTMQKLTLLFNDAAHSYIAARNEILRGVKTEDDIVTIGRPAPALPSSSLVAPAMNGLEAVRIHGAPNVQLQTLSNRSMMKNGKGIVVLNGPPDDNEVIMQPTLDSTNTIMPGAFTMAPQDTIVEKIFTEIFSMMDLMKATSSVMPLAADEFQIIPHEYPIRASGDIHAALYRLSALVYTMACAWKTMREKGYFTADMLHILHNLSPITNDIARCLDRFTHVMEFYVRFPSSGVSSELTKGTMQFRALCVELSARKERDLIAVIRKTIFMKRVRDDEVQEEDNGAAGGHDGDDDDFAGSYGTNGNSGSGGGGGGAGGAPDTYNYNCPPRPRSHLDEWGSSHGHHTHTSPRSSNKYRRRRGNSQRRRRHGSPNGANERSTSHRYSSPHSGSSPASASSRPNDSDRYYNNNATKNSNLTHLPQAPSTAPEPGKPNHQSSNLNRDLGNSTLMHPLAGDSMWLPVPREEIPEIPHRVTSDNTMNGGLSVSSTKAPLHSAPASSVPPPHLQHRQTSREAYEDDMSGTSPRSHGGTVSNATRVFDASILPPPPPMRDEQQQQQQHSTNNASSSYTAASGRVQSQLPPTGLEASNRAATTTAGDESVRLYPDNSYNNYPRRAASAIPSIAPSNVEYMRQSSGAPTPHNRNNNSSNRRGLPPAFVAHEEGPAVKKPSALQRAEWLRENLRGGGQRHASPSSMSRHHSTGEIRAFGASYTVVAVDKSASLAGHVGSPSGVNHHRSHRSHHPRSRSLQHRSHSLSHSSMFLDEEAVEAATGLEDRPMRRANTATSGLEPTVPYGSREGDLALLGGAENAEGLYEPATVSPGEPLTADGIQQQEQQQPQRQQRRQHPNSSEAPAGFSAGARHNSQDCITLDHSSSNGEEVKQREMKDDDDAVDGSTYLFHDSDRDRRSSDSNHSEEHESYGDGDSDDYDSSSSGSSSSSSLVRFNDSFTTPITVQDAEGLHAFTLSLEMFGKELRRVLYGFEEMLQSL